MHRENRFLPSEIPLDILPAQLKAGKERTTAVREALIGSIAEHISHGSSAGVVKRKGANYYYSPHKSYIEFLVSQYFCRVPFRIEMCRTFFTFVNPEMISFVKEGPDVGAQNIAEGLHHVLGNVSRELIKIGAQSYKLRQDSKGMNKNQVETADRYLLYELYTKNEEWSELENLLLASINSARVEKTI